MDLNNLRETSNFDDRRGEGGGFGGFGGPSWGGGFGGLPAFGMRGGGLGLVGFIILILLFGSNGSGGLLDSVVGGSQQQQMAQADNHTDDAQLDFARKIVGSAEDVWTPILQARGVTFTPATITFYTQDTPTACGEGQSSAGPFYCPNDKRIYLDLSFFNQLADRFGAPGQFAQAYVIAHEYGHHIQNLVGTMDQHESQLQGSGARGAAGASVRLELQADCYAGVWTYHADQRFHILQQGDVEGGLRAASAVGDDTLEKQAQGQAVPDSFTHGTSAQRMRWFQRGLSRGEMADCDTFGAAAL
ncbi:MAG: neutral zinc metallopeptidase [Proteobacteria bacterium]|nr:neutral zinc metallopeptidase [Pseudomonadota bacterium]